MKIPDEIKEQIRQQLWAKAEELGWSDMADSERARHYEAWTRDAAVGGRLGHFMDPRKVRVYIKDSLLKPYERARLSNTAQAVFRLLQVGGVPFVHSYVKPHGRRLQDGRIICWGKSRDWKLVLMAAFERAKSGSGFSAYSVVFIESGKTSDQATRDLIADAAARLGIERVEWLVT
jgi:hypothetical protein